jgi:hypothetical protein
MAQERTPDAVSVQLQMRTPPGTALFERGMACWLEAQQEQLVAPRGEADALGAPHPDRLWVVGPSFCFSGSNPEAEPGQGEPSRP